MFIYIYFKSHVIIPLSNVWMVNGKLINNSSQLTALVNMHPTKFTFQYKK